LHIATLFLNMRYYYYFNILDLLTMIFVLWCIDLYLTRIMVAKKPATVRSLLKADGLSYSPKVRMDVPKKHDWWVYVLLVHMW